MITLSWIGLMLGAGGLWLAPKSPYGWLITSVGSAIWLFYALLTFQIPLAIAYVMYVTIEFGNWKKTKGLPTGQLPPKELTF